MLGEGTTFNIYFPLIDKDGTQKSSTADQVEKDKGNDRILIVDDEEHIAQSMSEYLSDFGYKVTVYNDSE